MPSPVGRLRAPTRGLAGEFASALRLAAAAFWYERGEISQDQAAQVAGLSRTQFLLELARTKSDAFAVELGGLRRELGDLRRELGLG